MAKYQFLTEEWVAAAKAIREEYDGQGPAPAHIVRMNLSITDSPITDGEIAAFMDTSEGTQDQGAGRHDQAHGDPGLRPGSARRRGVHQDQGHHRVAARAGRRGSIHAAATPTAVIAAPMR